MKIHYLLIMNLMVLACAEKPEHVIVYFEAGRFAGWPANNGIWRWGDEILVGFSRGYHKNLGEERHNIDREKPEELLLARSLDGGETWSTEDPSANGVLVARGEGGLHGTVPVYDNKKEPVDLQDPVVFTNPDLAVMFRFLDHNRGPSLFYFSYDRGHNWNGPFHLRTNHRDSLVARTNYIVVDRNTCMEFLSVPKAGGREGRPACIVTENGGLDWKLLSEIGPDPAGFGIMPSAVQVSKNRLVVTIRRREGDHRWIDAWSSDDGGKNWASLPAPVKDLGEGNPPCLIRLSDSRLCLTYAVRAEPYRICAQLSSDNGENWSDPIVLRDDGGGRDIGYVRSVQRPDGKVVTVYYFQDKQKPERYIAATIWKP